MHTQKIPSKSFLGYTLDAFQIQAATAIDKGHSVIVSAPTGSGKTLIAEYAIDKVMSASPGSRVIYTAPIKALSNQKYRDFSARYGARVGIVTGDVSIHAEAPLVIMTTEIFRNTLFQAVDRLQNVRSLIFDEIHFIADPERGTVWEESIIFAPDHIRLLCLSATVPNLDEFAGWMRSVRKGHAISVIGTDHRPVPLEHRFFYGKKGPFHLSKLKAVSRRKATPHKSARRIHVRHIVEFLRAEACLPCLFFSFSRRNCETLAMRCAGMNLVDRDTADRIAAQLDALCDMLHLDEDADLAKLRRLLPLGVGFHHAGLLPSHKEVVERLFTARLIRLLFTTETFAMGINMPAATVVFEDLEKYDGIAFDYIKRREYLQMAGRAGRRGMDETGHVYSLLHAGTIHWPRVKHVLQGQPEMLIGQLRPSYHTILNLFARMGRNVTTVMERSFRQFQRSKTPRRAGRRRPSSQESILLDKRLRCLENLGYIAGHALTEMGRFAARIPAYELQIAELYFSGILDGLNAAELNAVFMAVCFEPRKGTWYRTMPRRELPAVFHKAKRIVERIRKVEKNLHMETLSAPLNFKFTVPTLVWSEGGDFGDLQEFTDASPGDMVRDFRMLYQLLRQLRSTLDAGQALREVVREAGRRINRDVVDAERQLKSRLIEGSEARSP